MVERELTLIELSQASGLTGEEIIDLIELGVFEARRGEANEWILEATTVSLAKRASRLRSDFDLGTPGIALALAYLEKIESLEARLKELQCQILK